jgi:glycosidase
MPVAESPSYHGYDVADYYRVEQDYGTNEDFKRFTAEAHRRGIRVLVDLVLNHASSRSAYFQAALADTASPYRSWFRWSAVNPNTKGPWGQDLWYRSPAREEYYYSVFSRGMPDLILTNPAVVEETRKIARFWLEEMGVDGFRLDAVPYWVEEGERMMHAPANHTWLRDFAAFIRRTKPGAFTIGEVWDSTGALVAYYPNQLDAYFEFEIADSIIRAARTGSARPFLAAVARAEEALPEGRWAPFLRNHDQVRTMTELQGDFARARVASTLQLTLPGLPFIYYGEEIGMTGAKPDPRLRTPMQWSAGPGAGFSRGKPWGALQPDSLTANVAAQESDVLSLLYHYRRLIHLRARHPALASGRYVPLASSDGAVAAYLRRDGAGAALVLVNLGERATGAVSLSSEAAALAPGRYASEALLGGQVPAPLVVPPGGRIVGWGIGAALQPFESRIVELAPAVER